MNKITRRQALGTTAGALTVLGIAGATAHAAATDSRAATTPAGTVDEVYQGRRIQIAPGTKAVTTAATTPPVCRP